MYIEKPEKKLQDALKEIRDLMRRMEALLSKYIHEDNIHPAVQPSVVQSEDVKPKSVKGRRGKIAPKGYMTRKQFCLHVGCSERTLDKYTKSGLMSIEIVNGVTCLYKESDIEIFFKIKADRALNSAQVQSKLWKEAHAFKKLLVKAR